MMNIERFEKMCIRHVYDAQSTGFVASWNAKVWAKPTKKWNSYEIMILGNFGGLWLRWNDLFRGCQIDDLAIMGEVDHSYIELLK